MIEIFSLKMIYLVLISIFNQFLRVRSTSMAPQTASMDPQTTPMNPENTPMESDDSGKNFKIILALIVAIVLIFTILVIVIIILFALSDNSKKKRRQGKITKKTKKKTPEQKENNLNNNMVFVAKGQSDNEKAQNNVGASGSFIYSGYSSDKPIPIEETYATALQNSSASESGVYGQRPTDLNVQKPPKSTSVVIKDNKSKSGL